MLECVFSAEGNIAMVRGITHFVRGYQEVVAMHIVPSARLGLQGWHGNAFLRTGYRLFTGIIGLEGVRLVDVGPIHGLFRTP